MTQEPIAKIWQPPIAWAHIHKDDRERAERLRDALRPSLERRPPKWIGTVAEFERAGIEDYKRVFGDTISDRYFRKLIKRTIERDGGADNFARAELYLPEHPRRRAGSQPVFNSASEADFAELHELMAGFRKPSEPSDYERALLWLRSIEIYNARVDTGKKAKRVKYALLNFLWKHTTLAKSPHALRVNFDRKLAKWITTEGEANAFRDGRTLRKGKPSAPPIPQEDIDRIVWHSVANCGGRIAQAVRELVESEGLSPEIQSHFFTAKSKSYVPSRLREAVRYDVKMLEAHHQGPRAADKVKASLTRDYSGIYANTIFQADDFTMPALWYVPDGNGWFNLVRGQVLIVIDFRSLRILGYSLQPDAQYNSAVIRTLFTRVFEGYGLPKVLYLERGIWKRSKLITGGPKAERVARESDMPFSWAECEMGLRQFGVRFIHAKRARSKTIERVGGLVQDLMEREPGYVGREERYDKPEITTAREREVNARKAHPSKYFYSEEQWLARLGEIFDRYNSTMQQGRILNGLSPDEAYEKFQNADDPPERLGAECRFLLAHHRIPVTVTNEGVVFRVRGETYRYRDAQTGQHIGRQMIAWHNTEMPDLVTLTDRNLKHPFTVERHKPVAALDPDPELYAHEVSKVEGHAAHGKARYRLLKAKFQQKFRGVAMHPQTFALGQEMTAQQQAVQTRRTEAEARRVRVQRKAQELHVPASILGQRGDEAEGLEMMRRALREHEAEVTGEK